jgi:uncharacterized protein
MNAVSKIVSRYPLVSFFVLAYVLSWFSAPFTGGQLIPHGPAIAAVIVLALGEGRAGLARLWRQMNRWRVGWRWYFIAPLIVVTYLLAALVLNLLLGANITNSSRLLSPVIMGPLILELILLGGMWEEPGWSGFALPKLQDRFAGRPYGLLKANLLMGTFRAIWHLPLVLYGHIPWFDMLIFSFALQSIITWLYNRTQGSVLIVMLCHLASNIFGGGMMVPLFTGSDYIRYYILFIGFASLVALFLARRNNWSLGSNEIETSVAERLV